MTSKHISVLNLGYKNPGSDLDLSLYYNDDATINMKKTCDNLIEKLQQSIKKLQDFKENIDDDSKLDIQNEGKQIYIHGPDEILKSLEDKGILLPDEGSGLYDDYNEDYDDLAAMSLTSATKGKKSGSHKGSKH